MKELMYYLNFRFSKIRNLGSCISREIKKSLNRTFSRPGLDTLRMTDTAVCTNHTFLTFMHS